MTTLVLLLAGSRELPEPGIVTETIADIVLNIAEGPVVVRHGACPGEKSADQAVSDWIKECGEWLGVTEDPMPADWDNCTSNCPPGHRRIKKPGDTAHPGLLPDYCPAAGPRRNAAMIAKEPRAGWMLAFPHGASYGTRNCMRLAKAAGIKVSEVTA